MIRTFCDTCGNEGKVKHISYPCHLDPSGKWNGYVDFEGNNVSGRDEHLDVCQKCFNIVYGSLVDKIFELKAQIKKDD